VCVNNKITQQIFLYWKHKIITNFKTNRPTYEFVKDVKVFAASPETFGYTVVSRGKWGTGSGHLRHYQTFIWTDWRKLRKLQSERSARVTAVPNRRVRKLLG